MPRYTISFDLETPATPDEMLDWCNQTLEDHFRSPDLDSVCVMYAADAPDTNSEELIELALELDRLATRAGDKADRLDSQGKRDAASMEWGRELGYRRAAIKLLELLGCPLPAGLPIDRCIAAWRRARG